VKQKGLLYWDEACCRVGEAQVKVVVNDTYEPQTVLEYSAFTVAKLGEMLPARIEQLGNKLISVAC
jgi:hypothetical protein